MGKLLAVVLFISSLIFACSTQTNKKVSKDTQQTSANVNVETKTDTSSSSAKAMGQSDSAVTIRPIHKYKHQKKYKIK